MYQFFVMNLQQSNFDCFMINVQFDHHGKCRFIMMHEQIFEKKIDRIKFNCFYDLWIELS